MPFGRRVQRPNQPPGGGSSERGGPERGSRAGGSRGPRAAGGNVASEPGFRELEEAEEDGSRSYADDPEYRELRDGLFEALIARINVANLEAMAPEEARAEMRDLLRELIDARELPLSASEEYRVINDVIARFRWG